MGKRSRGPIMSGVGNLLRTLGDFRPILKEGTRDAATAAVVEELVQLENVSVEETERPPPKRARASDDHDKNWEDLDAQSLVPYYETISDVPAHLQKYFAQRHRFFSRYDMGCLLDEEGWFSVTPEKIADQISERCRCDTVLDAFCGVGGNAIAFAKTCHKVIALDISPVRLALARHNAAIYGVEDRIEFILADYLEYARVYSTRPQEEQNIDVVFLSPPWGGPQYMALSPQNEKDESDTFMDDPSTYSLKSIVPVPGDRLFRISRRISKNIAYFLPRNVNLDEVSQLTSNPESTQREAREEMVEVEEECMGGKLKAVTCYFGGLVSGQEDMF